MTLTRVAGVRHVCPLPRFIDQFEHEPGEVRRCDGCGRYWRLLMGSRYHDWQRVGWWESRKIRRNSKEHHHA
jgi:hypothetical protein